MTNLTEQIEHLQKGDKICKEAAENLKILREDKFNSSQFDNDYIFTATNGKAKKIIMIDEILFTLQKISTLANENDLKSIKEELEKLNKLV